MHRSSPLLRRKLVIASALATAAAAGCAPSRTIPVDPRFIPRAAPTAYSDGDFATVLRQHVDRGQVRYARLSQDREPLERYLGLISVAGPQSTPGLFPKREDRICYYANAHNACVLLCVLENYPTTSVHTIKLPLEYSNHFRVDGKDVNLGQLRDLMTAEADGDVRLLFCLSGAALGSPRLAAEPLRPVTLQEQVSAALNDGLTNPYLVRIDAESREVFLWDPLVNDRQEVLNWQNRRGGRSTANLIEALAAMAGDEPRRRLLAAADYKILRMPFDRRLNDSPPPATAGG